MSENHHHDHDHGHDLNIKKIDRLSSTQVRLTVEFSEETVRKHENATANRYLHSVRIPGFRPGKAPLKMIRERYKDDIRKDVVSHLLEAGLAEAIEKTKLSPVNRPRIELGEGALGDGKPFEFHAEFEIQPEIEIKNYKGVPLKSASLNATDDEVEKTVENLRDRVAVLEPTDKQTPEKGHYAVIEIGYELTSNPSAKEAPKEFTVALGDGELLPELESALLEMKTGDSKDVTAKFPAEYNDKKLAGKEAVFHCKLVELKVKVLPDVNDAFANQIKEGATLESLKQEIRESVVASKKDEQEKAHRNDIIDYLVSKNQFDVPQSLVEQQTVSLLQWMEKDMRNRGFSAGQLKKEEMDSVRKRAEHMVRSTLILKEIALKEQISLDEAKVQDRVGSVAQQLNRSIEETEKFLSGKGMLDRLRDEVLTDQIFEFLLQNALFEVTSSST